MDIHNRVCTESWLQRKIPCHTWESNLHQKHVGSMLYQLSFISTQKLGLADKHVFFFFTYFFYIVLKPFVLYTYYCILVGTHWLQEPSLASILRWGVNKKIILLLWFTAHYAWQEQPMIWIVHMTSDHQFWKCSAKLLYKASRNCTWKTQRIILLCWS